MSVLESGLVAFEAYWAFRVFIGAIGCDMPLPTPGPCRLFMGCFWLD